MTGKYLVLIFTLATELNQASSENDNVNGVSLYFYILHAWSCLQLARLFEAGLILIILPCFKVLLVF